jgi:Tfp pilus assembly protein PilF
MKSVRQRKRKIAGEIVSSLLVFAFVSGQTAQCDPTTSPPEAKETSQETNPDTSAPQQGGVSKSQTGSEEVSDREAQRNEQIGKATEHFQTAHKYVKRGDLNLAEVEMQEAIAAAPQIKAFHRDYCLVALAKFEPALAAAEFMLATGLGDPIPYSEQEKQDLDKKAAKLHYAKGISYGYKSRWIPAAAEMEKALEYTPQNATIKRSLAFAYGNEGRFDLAEKAYQDSFGQSPEDAFSHADFAFLLNEHGKQQSAFDQLAKAVELQPQSAALRVDLAWLCEKDGKFQQAGDELKEAIKLSPGHAVLWSHLGRVLEHEGDSAAAKAAYTKAVALDPNQDQAQEGLKKLAGK